MGKCPPGRWSRQGQRAPWVSSVPFIQSSSDGSYFLVSAALLWYYPVFPVASDQEDFQVVLSSGHLWYHTAVVMTFWKGLSGHVMPFLLKTLQRLPLVLKIDTRFFLPALLSYNWLITLWKFKVYNVMICYLHMLQNASHTVTLVNTSNNSHNYFIHQGDENISDLLS